MRNRKICTSRRMRKIPRADNFSQKANFLWNRLAWKIEEIFHFSVIVGGKCWNARIREAHIYPKVPTAGRISTPSTSREGTDNVTHTRKMQQHRGLRPARAHTRKITAPTSLTNVVCQVKKSSLQNLPYKITKLTCNKSWNFPYKKENVVFFA